MLPPRGSSGRCAKVQPAGPPSRTLRYRGRRRRPLPHGRLGSSTLHECSLAEGVRVTLNITLFDKERIYQSSDFRLTLDGQVVTDSSTKAIVIQNTEFDGLITYTGVGKWAGRDTRDFVVEWLESVGDVERWEVAASLGEAAQNWMIRINRSVPERQRLTLVLATFDKGSDGAQITVISNFEDSRGFMENPSDKFCISTRYASRQPQALVTGFKPAFNKDARKQLERLARNHKNEPQFIRNAMREANRLASESPKARGTISSGCTVVCLYRDGRGFQDFTEGSNVDVRHVVRGRAGPDLRELLKNIGVSSASIVGSTFVRASSGRSDEPCEVRIRGGDDAYDAAVVALPEASSSTATGISDAGLIVGTHEALGFAGSRCGWRTRLAPRIEVSFNSDIAMVDIQHLTTSPSGLVLGAATTDEGFTHAITWEGETIAPLGDYPGRDSMALGANSEGTVIGWASVNGDDRGQRSQRPAAWDPTGRLSLLREIPSDWGHAIAISANRMLLLLNSAPFDSWSALCELNQSIDIVSGAEGGKGVYPLGMSSDGLILGMVDALNGKLAVISPTGSDWENLGTPAGWYPDCISSNGIIAGHVNFDGFERAWVLDRRDGLGVKILPHCLYHHCRPTSVNANGHVVGWARTDHGSHAVVWQRRS